MGEAGSGGQIFDQERRLYEFKPRQIQMMALGTPLDRLKMKYFNEKARHLAQRFCLIPLKLFMKLVLCLFALDSPSSEQSNTRCWSCPPRYNLLMADNAWGNDRYAASAWGHVYTC
jgi:hypothetical protein